MAAMRPWTILATAALLWSCSETPAHDAPTGAGGSGATTGSTTGPGGAGASGGCDNDGCSAVEWLRQYDDQAAGAELYGVEPLAGGSMLTVGSRSCGGTFEVGMAQPLDVGPCPWRELFALEVDGDGNTVRALSTETQGWGQTVGGAITASASGGYLLTTSFQVDVAIGGNAHTTPVAPYIDANGMFLPGFDGLGDAHALVAKLDAMLGVEWSLSFGNDSYPLPNPQETTLTSIDGRAFDANGDVVLVGAFQHQLNVASATLTSAGGVDGFMIRLSPSGSLVAAASYGASGNDWLTSVAPHQASSLVITGSYEGSIDIGTTTLPSQGTRTQFVAGLDAAGQVQWSHSFAGSGGLEAQVQSDGHVVLAVVGSDPISIANQTLTPTGAMSLALVELDADGTALRAALVADGAIERISTAVDQAGSVAISAVVNGPSSVVGDSIMPQAPRDLVVARLDASWQPSWVQRFGPASQTNDPFLQSLVTWLSDVAFDSDGHLLLAGRLGPATDFGNGPVPQLTPDPDPDTTDNHEALLLELAP